VPKINGKTVALGKNESAWVMALAPDDSACLLGCSYSLRCYEPDSALRWQVVA
jgi:hypothetical protein